MARKGERDPKRERFWRAVLKRRQRSGLSVREFCRGERLSEASYYYWRREVARRDREPRPTVRRGRAAEVASRAATRKARAASGPLFRELAILAGPSSSGEDCLEILLPDGCRLRVPSAVDRQLLCDVLVALEARRC